MRSSRAELEIVPAVGNKQLRERKFLSLFNEYLSPVTWKHPCLKTGTLLAGLDYPQAAFPSDWLAGDGARTVRGGLRSPGLLFRKRAPVLLAGLSCLHFALLAEGSLVYPDGASGKSTPLMLCSTCSESHVP